MDAFRIVPFYNPDDFLKVMQQRDGSVTNFGAGALLECKVCDGESCSWDSKKKTLIGIYKRTELIATLTSIEKDFAWVLSNAREEDVPWTVEDITSASDCLAFSLRMIIDIREVDKVFGPALLVTPFTDALATILRTQGEVVKVVDYFHGTVLRVTAATLPPPSPACSERSVTLAATPSDAEGVAPLYIEFTRGGPVTATFDEAREKMDEARRQKGLWRCHVNGEIAGFIVVGRFTPKTASIKNVFVRAEYRRKGVGETMVRAVTRYYLGVKKELCLNVIEEGAQRLYGRCGFVLPGESGKLEDVNWYRSSLRGILPG